MKKVFSVAGMALFVTLALASFSFAKEAKEKDVKINPKVDFAKLDTTAYTVYAFENAAGEGQDILDTIYDELAQMMDRNKMKSTLYKKPETEAANDEFSIGKDTKGADSSVYASSPTDLVLSGKLIRFDSKTKQKLFGGAKYWTASMEVFVYSKSLDTIVYKANLTRIFQQKSGSSKTARRTIFRACLEELMQSYFEKAAAPATPPPAESK